MSDKEKFKNINNVFNNGFCSIDTLNKDKINKNIFKSEKENSNYKNAIIVKHKEIIKNNIFKCFGLNITGNMKSSVDMYYLSFDDIEKDYKLGFRVLPKL